MNTRHHAVEGSELEKLRGFLQASSLYMLHVDASVAHGMELYHHTFASSCYRRGKSIENCHIGKVQGPEAGLCDMCSPKAAPAFRPASNPDEPESETEGEAEAGACPASSFVHIPYRARRM